MTVQPVREVHIHRADGPEVAPVLIRIEHEQETPQYGDPAFTHRTGEMFKADGKALADAIWEACPGGTISELIAELLSRRACQFRVRMPQEVER